MPRITKVVVGMKQGLPNYSSRDVSVEIIADEGETLKLIPTIKEVQEKIKEAWGVKNSKEE